MAWWKSLKEWFGALWLALKQLYVFLLLLRFSFLALGILLFAFRFSDQGTDILRALAEEKDRRIFNITLFILFTNLLAYEVWYWSRHLLKYRPHVDPDTHDKYREPLPQDLPLATEWIPRLAGLLVFAIEIVGLAHVGHGVSGLIWLVVASAVLYLIIVITRRSIFKIAPDGRYEQKTSLDKFEPVTKFMFVLALVAEFVLFVWACWSPVTWSKLGPGAALVLIVAVWLPVGTFLVILGERLRFPILGALLVWTFLISRCADNHPIRYSHPIDPLTRATLDKSFDDWFKRVSPQHAGHASVPVVIVAAEGGGIRAAYWTATALTALQDKIPGFADHCFALSGVSGGALGELVFNAVLARRMEEKNALADATVMSVLGENPATQRDVRKILQFDALSGTLASLAQPDFVQRFFPAVAFPDREKALEEGWERGWSKAFEGNDLFGRALLETMQKHQALPNLFLNGTVVETGDRIITSNVRIHPSPYFRNAFDAFDLMRLDIPFSSAAGMSARFTYISPAGKIPYHGAHDLRERIACTNLDHANPNCGREWFGHVVDGGYFEVSGSVTAKELYDFVMEKKKDARYKKVEPVIVLIDHWNDMSCRNCPTDPRLFCPAPGYDGPGPPAASENFANELLSPIRAVLAARDARGKQAIGDAARETMAVLEFRLAPRKLDDTKLPLGWILSDESMNAIDDGVTGQNGNVTARNLLKQFLENGLNILSTGDCASTSCGQASDAKGSTYTGGQ